MSLLPDHVLCPALKRWLPHLLEDARPATWSPDAWTPPRSLRKLVADLPACSDADFDTAVVVTPLLPDLPLHVVPPGTRLIEIGVVVPSSAFARLRPWRRRQAAAAQTAERFARWLESGLDDAEQWVSLDPDDTVVTLGRLRDLDRSHPALA